MMMMKLSVALVLAATQTAAFTATPPSSSSPSSTVRLSTALNLETLDVSALSSMDPSVLIGAAAATIGIAGSAIFMGRENNDNNNADASTETTTSAPEPEPEPIDVSIPYDAAARLAYESMGIARNADNVDVDFETDFRPIYEQKCIYEVILKKYQSKLATIDDQLDAMMPTNDDGDDDAAVTTTEEA